MNSLMTPSAVNLTIPTKRANYYYGRSRQNIAALGFSHVLALLFPRVQKFLPLKKPHSEEQTYGKLNISGAATAKKRIANADVGRDCDGQKACALPRYRIHA
jgi:hypothetical protein